MTDDFKQFINEKILLYLPQNRVRRGDHWNFSCPLCHEGKSKRKKRGYFSISNCVYHCFNCDASLSGFKFLKILSGADFEDIKNEYRELKARKGDTCSFRKQISENEQLSAISYLNSLQSAIKPEWKNPLTEIASKYLNDRKVLDAPFLKGKLYSVFDKNKNEYILIPWKINGIDAYYQVNDFRHNDSLGRKYIFPSGKEKLVYGLDNIDLSFPYIICLEGVYDSLFIPNAVAIGGKSLTKFQHELISKRYPNHQIVLSFDNDEAGFSAMAKEIRKNPTEFKYLKWFGENTKEKDINDFILKKNNAEAFKDKKIVEKMIISSITMKMFLIQRGIWKNG